jgi:hypothetical protein
VSRPLSITDVDVDVDVGVGIGIGVLRQRNPFPIPIPFVVRRVPRDPAQKLIRTPNTPLLLCHFVDIPGF